MEEVHVHFDPALPADNRVVAEVQLLSGMLLTRALHAIAPTPSNALQSLDDRRPIGHRTDAIRLADVVEIDVDGQPR